MKKGQVWKIRHDRKGILTVRLLENINPKKEWFDSVIIIGRAKYMSVSNRFEQVEFGKGMGGSTITSRISFVRFIERHKELEGKGVVA